jgi:hypothetical protein
LMDFVTKRSRIANLAAYDIAARECYVIKTVVGRNMDYSVVNVAIYNVRIMYVLINYYCVSS